MAAQLGLSYKDIAQAITSFLEITFHTLLCLRQMYPATTFTRRRAHGVPVYQSRHPQVKKYISEIVALISKEIQAMNLGRVYFVVKNVEDGLPLERFILDFGYLGVDVIGECYQREAGLIDSPTADELSLMLRGFLIRLTSLDTQLDENKGELTFGIVIETLDGKEPSSNAPTNDSVPSWIPALAADTLHPTADEECVAKHEPLLNVKAIETGVIDVRMMVQECVAKTGVENLRI